MRVAVAASTADLILGTGAIELNLLTSMLQQDVDRLIGRIIDLLAEASEDPEAVRQVRLWMFCMGGCWQDLTKLRWLGIRIMGKAGKAD